MSILLLLRSSTAAPQTLSASLFTDADTFFGGTLSTSVTLTPTLFSDADTFFGGTLTQGAASQTLTASLFTDADTFFGGTISQDVLLSISRMRALESIVRLHGLINPLTVSASQRGDGTITQSVTDDGTTTTVTTVSNSNIAFNPQWIDDLAAIYGVTAPLLVTDTQRSAGGIVQSIITNAGVTRVTRL